MTPGPTVTPHGEGANGCVYSGEGRTQVRELFPYPIRRSPHSLTSISLSLILHSNGAPRMDRRRKGGRFFYTTGRRRLARVPRITTIPARGSRQGLTDSVPCARCAGCCAEEGDPDGAGPTCRHRPSAPGRTDARPNGPELVQRTQVWFYLFLFNFIFSFFSFILYYFESKFRIQN